MRIILTLALLTSFMVCNGQEDAQEAYSAGVKLLNENQFVEAEAKFREALEKGTVEDGIKMSNIYLGFALNGQGKYAEAIPYFSKAIDIDPQDQASYIDRALAYAYSHDNKNAVKDFYKALEIDSLTEKAQAAYYYLGRIAFSEMDMELAVEFYTKLLNLAPKDAEAYFLRGTAKSNMMDSEGAIADYNLAIKNNPEYMEAYANRGVAKINLVPTSVKLDEKLKCLDEPCVDLLKAKSLGDTSVEDMIYLYCKKCK